MTALDIEAVKVRIMGLVVPVSARHRIVLPARRPQRVEMVTNREWLAQEKARKKAA